MEDRSKIIAKEDFCTLSADDIEFTLVRDEKLHDITYYMFQIRIVPINAYYKVFKRHSEFESLYEALSITFAQLEFPKPPSKFKVLHKVKRRKEFYLDILQSIKNFMTKYPEYKEMFLIKLYQFFMPESKFMKEEEIVGERQQETVEHPSPRKSSHSAGDEKDMESELFEASGPSTFTRDALYEPKASEGLKVRY